jgi:hypothetical protein
MIRTGRSQDATTAHQCNPAIRPTTSHRGSPTVRAGTSTRFGSSHSACPKILCLIVFAALFSGSNSNSTAPGYRNYTRCVEASDTPSALLYEFQMVS